MIHNSFTICLENHKKCQTVIDDYGDISVRHPLKCWNPVTTKFHISLSKWLINRK